MKCKFLYTILLLIVVSFSSASLMKRAKRGASNTWNGGYDVTLKCGPAGGSSRDGGNGILYATKIINPTDNCDTLGVGIKNISPTGDLKNVMTQCPNDTQRWFIPYRNIAGKATYTNPFGGNKYIEFLVRPDNSPTGFTVRINLPYKTFGWYINDDEGNQIKSAINTNCERRKTIVTEAKVATVTNSNIYITKKPLVDAVLKSGGELQKKINELKSSNEALIAKNKADVTNLDQVKNQYTGIKSQELQLKETTNNLKAQLSALSTQETSLETKVKEAQGKKTLSTDEVKTCKTKVDAQKDAWDNSISTLKSIAPQRVVDCDAATNDLLKLNLNGITASFSKIFPKK